MRFFVPGPLRRRIEYIMTVSGTDSISARSFETRAREAAAKTLAHSRLEEMSVAYIEESAGLSAGLWQLPGGEYEAVCGEGDRKSTRLNSSH